MCHQSLKIGQILDEFNIKKLKIGQILDEFNIKKLKIDILNEENVPLWVTILI